MNILEMNTILDINACYGFLFFGRGVNHWLTIDDLDDMVAGSKSSSYYRGDLRDLQNCEHAEDERLVSHDDITHVGHSVLPRIFYIVLDKSIAYSPGEARESSDHSK